MTQLFVLDASVAVKWFFVDEVLREKALEVRNALIATPERFQVPPLFFSELIHVLARKSKNDGRFVAEAIDLVLRLGIRTSMLSRDGFSMAVVLACKGLSGYDATYAALAKTANAKWLTADIDAIKKLEPGLALSLVSFV